MPSFVLISARESGQSRMIGKIPPIGKLFLENKGILRIRKKILKKTFAIAENTI